MVFYIGEDCFYCSSGLGNFGVMKYFVSPRKGLITKITVCAQKSTQTYIASSARFSLLKRVITVNCTQ